MVNNSTEDKKRITAQVEPMSGFVCWNIAAQEQHLGCELQVKMAKHASQLNGKKRG